MVNLIHSRRRPHSKIFLKTELLAWLEHAVFLCAGPTAMLLSFSKEEPQAQPD
jgi:hypothetical protein